jgi:hypothetical protein
MIYGVATALAIAMGILNAPRWRISNGKICPSSAEILANAPSTDIRSLS